MNKLEKLRSRRDELTEELRTLAAVDAAELTGQQDQRLAAIEDELERSEGDETVGLLADIAREERREELRNRALSAPSGGDGGGGERGIGTEGGSQPDAWRDRNIHVNGGRRGDPFDLSGVPAYGEQRAKEVRSRAIDAIERSTRFVSDDHKQSITRHVERNGHDPFYAEYVLSGASEAYADGFLRSLTGGVGGMGADLSPEERHALQQRHLLARAMGLSDVTGVLVPSHLDTMLILANDGRTNPMRRYARVETGTTNVYRSVRTSGVSHDWTAEAGEVGDNAPSFANPTATAYKGTVFVPVSFEAFEDARGRESDIVSLIDDAVDDAEATVFATGNGTTRPRGLITALDANTNAEVATTTSNVFGQVDVYSVYEQLPPRYRRNARWFANLSILNDVRQFDTQANAANRGYPGVMPEDRVHEYSEMDGTVGTAGTDNILAVGDPSTYLIYDRLGTSVELVPHLMGTTNGRPTGQRGWLAHHRTGANLTVGHAASDSVVGFRLLQAETNS